MVCNRAPPSTLVGWATAHRDAANGVQPARHPTFVWWATAHHEPDRSNTYAPPQNGGTGRASAYLKRFLGEGHRLRHAMPCPPDRPGRQSVPASARPALGGRFSPAGSGAGLLGFAVWPLPAGAGAHGRGKRMRFLFPPGLREACQGARWASDRKGATGRTQRWATAHPTVVGWANAHRFRRGGLPPILRDTQVALANAPGTGPHGGLPPTLQAPRWGGPLSRHQMVGNRPPCRRVRTRPHTTPR